MKTLVIGALSLRRVFSDRANIFFVVLLPFLMVFAVGLMHGDDRPLLAVADRSEGELSERLADALAEDDRLDVVDVEEDEALSLVEDGAAQAALVIPDDYDSRIAEGGSVELRLLTRDDSQAGADVATWTRSLVAQESSVLSAAQVAESARGGDFLDLVESTTSADVEGVVVETTTLGVAPFPEGLSAHSLAAPPMLLLYTFITALTTSLTIVQARNSGILRRLYATPTSASGLVLGEVLGRFLISLTQALLILFGSALVFRVDWGNLWATSLVVAAFCLVSSGAALLLGSTVRSEGGVIGVAVGVSLGAGALGGTMVPLEAFGGGSELTVSFLTPHAWGYTAFSELVREQAGLVDVLPQLGVLLAYAAVLLLLGTWRFRVVLTR
ncbi:ABC-2 type transport system permease protein [Nocardiopsis sp. Huas11]|uniref:ABC transporter permease n=1 Tax=Nocardiopsis sp. Huas11 TaxID=2183912 RepID=UPI000EAD9A52|nr:ABC transporter permease [Nocardiopsis sp. Huas11]RKS06878.1 ABC-2 type transport system permease protein [Nocardiopsis sp. Huas11]